MKKSEAKNIVMFKCNDVMLESLERLRCFYELTVRSRTLRTIVAEAILRVAALPEDSGWSKEQKESWLFCRGLYKNLTRVIISNRRSRFDKAVGVGRTKNEAKE